MRYSCAMQGVCSKKVDFDLEDNIIKNVVFFGGCNGNLKAIAKLIEGRSIEEISSLLKGTTCGKKSTSCADQLVKAIEGVM